MLSSQLDGSLQFVMETVYEVHAAFDFEDDDNLVVLHWKLGLAAHITSRNM